MPKRRNVPATNHKDIMPKENKEKEQEPQSGSANTEKGQENGPRRKTIRQLGSQMYNLQW